jgi:hypothetical protein
LRQLKKKLKRISKPEIHRRNTGYAVDILLKSDFSGTEPTINVGKLLCGSEGFGILLQRLPEGRYFTQPIM